MVRACLSCLWDWTADMIGQLMQVIAVICVLVWLINIPRFSDPIHGNWVSAGP